MNELGPLFLHPTAQLDWVSDDQQHNPSVWNSANWTFPDLDLTSFMEADMDGLGSSGSDGSSSYQQRSSAGLRTAIIATAYALVMAISLFGNLLVCYVVFRHRRLQRSITYTFLVNVALSDLLMTCLNIVRIGCQRSSSRQNSSFSSFVYCSLADLDSSHFLFYYFDFLPTSFDLAFRYKTPPNAVLLQSILGCSVGLVLAHPSRV
jgi:hypothetical protein